ncbi:hypothetical protein SAMN04488557_2180 [Hyphomicrobium facile]|uniref:Uncharacterized protein n=2 Tax=Hyphomicrobium facile TaxID=51670 RepID=A0A1I7NH77_9HYPH|nr:hypothetical protein SAMN04488557_2180 [Hyphomicrobium facile]
MRHGMVIPFGGTMSTSHDGKRTKGWSTSTTMSTSHDGERTKGWSTSTKMTAIVILFVIIVGLALIGSDGGHNGAGVTTTFGSNGTPFTSYGASNEQIQAKQAAESPEPLSEGTSSPASSSATTFKYNDIVLNVSLDQLTRRMNLFEASISGRPLVQVNELSNEEVFTRVYKIQGSITLIVVQNKQLAKIRDATLIWSRENQESALAGMLQLTGLVGAVSPDLSKRKRAAVASELIKGLNEDGPVTRDTDDLRFSCSVAMGIMCSVASRKMPLD